MLVRFDPRLALLACCAVLSASAAHAQAMRTWVSGVGDDVNPCSRTAPCKTFAGAISKTFINGEIDVLDPGGFGTITITKSITLDGTSGSGFGSILASGVNGVIINIAAGNPNDPLRTVRLRNLSINGAGASGSIGTRTGLNGIRILNANTVYVENVVISDFSVLGISDERTAGKLFVTNSIIRNNATNGILIGNVGSTTVNATLDHVISQGNVQAGVAALNGARVTARNVNSSGNGVGYFAAGASAELNLESCVSSGNATGIQTSTPGAPIIRLSNCAVFSNATGLQNGAGSLLSFGNNKVGGNTAGNTGVTAASPGQQ